MVKSVTVPGKCYAISDGDRQDDPKIFHMITFLNILISPSSIPKSDLVLSHNLSCDVPISTSPVPKSHICMSHN